MMGPKGRAMPSELEAALTDSFGSTDAFKDAFKAAGAGQFGSGWCWFCLLYTSPSPRDLSTSRMPSSA